VQRRWGGSWLNFLVRDWNGVTLPIKSPENFKHHS
jgi:hypothetical protein